MMRLICLSLLLTSLDARAQSCGLVANVAPVLTSDVHFSGRFATGNVFDWSGGGVSASFTGTGIAVTLSGGPASFVATVDGVKGSPFATTASPVNYTLATGLAPGLHAVVVRRRSEAQWGATTFAGFAVTAGALVQLPAPAYSHHLLVLGDSITCGYGAAGVNGTCHYDTDTEDETIAYPMLLAALLGADVQVVAYQGKGLYQDFTGSTVNQVPTLFERTLAEDTTNTWVQTRYTPDIIVINLGTNDQAFGDPGTAFEDTYVTFLAHLRSLFPSARIYFGQGPMGQLSFMPAHFANVLARAADPNIHFVTIDDIDPADGFGCDGHPNAITHQKMAEQLLAQIEATP